MNQEIYKIKYDIRLFLKEIKEDTKKAYEYITNQEAKYNKDTIRYILLDISASIDMIQTLIDKIESEDQYDQLR